jgi:hypothetical protein
MSSGSLAQRTAQLIAQLAASPRAAAERAKPLRTSGSRRRGFDVGCAFDRTLCGYYCSASSAHWTKFGREEHLHLGSTYSGCRELLPGWRPPQLEFEACYSVANPTAGRKTSYRLRCRTSTVVSCHDISIMSYFLDYVSILNFQFPDKKFL